MLSAGQPGTPMTSIDQFESAFNAASRDVFHIHPVPMGRVAVVTDLDEEEAVPFLAAVKKMLSSIAPADAHYVHIGNAQYQDVDVLVEQVTQATPDLICTYRNLKSSSYRWPYSLGSFLNVLTRKTDPPVLLLPHPKLDSAYSWTLHNTDRVMVVTDHLSGDERLVNTGLACTEPGGTLFLAHIEDAAAFARYVAVIAKIPEIDTEAAEREIEHRLLKEPADYIENCSKVIESHSKVVKVKPLIRMGHHISDYRKLVEENEVDLLILRTMEADGEAFALQGASYALAIVLNRLPLLMI